MTNYFNISPLEIYNMMLNDVVYVIILVASVGIIAWLLQHLFK